MFTPRPASRYRQFQMMCKRRGKILEGGLDLYNDPSQEYDGTTPVYYCRNVLTLGASPLPVT
jgi:hypothetical protein